MNELGDFLGGVGSALAFVWIVQAYRQTQYELKLSRSVIEGNSKSQSLQSDLLNTLSEQTGALEETATTLSCRIRDLADAQDRQNAILEKGDPIRLSCQGARLVNGELQLEFRVERGSVLMAVPALISTHLIEATESGATAASSRSEGNPHEFHLCYRGESISLSVALDGELVQRLSEGSTGVVEVAAWNGATPPIIGRNGRPQSAPTRIARFHYDRLMIAQSEGCEPNPKQSSLLGLRLDDCVAIKGQGLDALSLWS